MGWARVKVFQLSDGKISARFWHIATRRQMWLQLKTVTPHANQPEQLHSPLSTLHSRSLPFSPLSEVDSIADPFTQVSQPEHASDRQADWQTDRSRNRNMANCKKKKEFIISVLIAFFILSKIFSASRSHKPSLSNFLNPPLSPTGSAFCMFRPHLSQTNNCLQEIQLCLLITDAPSGQISSTRTKRMLQAASKCFRYNFESYNRKWFP